MTVGHAVVTLAVGVADAIVRHARAAAPRECCGLLIGSAARIDEAAPTRNLDPHQARFQIDPAEHIRLNRVLRGTGRAVVGVYHSHPATPAEPSISDVAEAHYDEFIYLIVSLLGTTPSLRAYRIVDGVVSPLLIG